MDNKSLPDPKIDIVWVTLGFKKSLQWFVGLNLIFWTCIFMSNLGIYFLIPGDLGLILLILPFLLFLNLCSRTLHIPAKDVLTMMGFKSRTDSGRPILLYCLVIVLILCLLTTLLLFWGNESLVQAHKDYESLTNISMIFLGIIGYVVDQIIQVAIWEEVLFRIIFLSFFITFLKKYKAGTSISIFISSVFFALAHPLCIQSIITMNPLDGYQLNRFIIHFLLKFLAGIVFSFLYLSSGNIFFPIFAHAAYNTYTLIFTLVTEKIAIARIDSVTQEIVKNCNEYYNKTVLPQVQENCEALLRNQTDAFKQGCKSISGKILNNDSGNI